MNLSTRHVKRLREFIGGLNPIVGWDPFEQAALLDLLGRPKPSPKKKAAKSHRRTEKKATAKSHREETFEIRKAIVERANGMCECCCGRSLHKLDPGQMDHFFGRGKLPQAIENVWLLSADCHAAKTLGKPSAAHWLERFVAHCRVFGYRHEESRAVDRLAFVRARSGEALKEATP